MGLSFFPGKRGREVGPFTCQIQKGHTTSLSMYKGV